MPEYVETAADREKRTRERDAAIRALLTGSRAPAPVPLRSAPEPDPVEAYLRPAAPTLPPITGQEALRSVYEPELATSTAERAAEHERARRGIEAARERRVNREAAYERAPITEGVAGDIMGMSNEAEAGRAGTFSGVSLGLDDEIAGMLRSQLRDEPYHQQRREYGRERRAYQERAPGWYAAGEVLGTLPYAILTPAGGANTTAGALGVGERMLSAGARAMPVAAVQGFGRSEDSLVPRESLRNEGALGRYAGQVGNVAYDTGVGAAQGFGYGAGGQLIGEGVGRLAAGVADELAPGAPRTPRMASELREDEILRQRAINLETEAAARRLREASGGRALLGSMRSMDEAGGVQNVASELRDAGVVAPRGTMFQSPRDAIPRAEVLRREVGQRIGAVDDAVTQAAATNPDALVELEGLASQYARVAERLAEAGDDAGAVRMMRVAERMSEEGAVPMSRARALLADIDAAVYGRHGGIPSPQVSRLDEEFTGGLRRALRTDMDRAIERVTPTRGAPLAPGAQGPAEALPTHLADRRRSQALIAFGEALDDQPLRDAARRVVSPSDTAAGLAGSMSGGPVTGATMWIANRVLRANEHGVAAAFAEREAEALTRELARRLSAPTATRVLERLRPALARGRHITALTLMDIARDEPEVMRAMQDAEPAPADDADDARMRELLPSTGGGAPNDINEDEDEARMRDLL